MVPVPGVDEKVIVQLLPGASGAPQVLLCTVMLLPAGGVAVMLFALTVAFALLVTVTVPLAPSTKLIAVGLTLIDGLTPGILVTLKMSAVPGCEHKNGVGALLPTPWVLHTSGPPIMPDSGTCAPFIVSVSRHD